jgi:hypothetical protein
VLAAGATVAGALAGEHLGLALTAACGLASATAAITLGRRRSAGAQTGAVFGLVALGLLGALSMIRALDGLDGPLAGLARSGDEVVVAAHLVDDPAGGRAGVQALARLEADGWRSHVLVEARGEAAMRLRLLAAGETAVLAGRLRPLEGRLRAARWRHAAAALVADDLFAARPGSSAFRLANRLRALVLRGSFRSRPGNEPWWRVSWWATTVSCRPIPPGSSAWPGYPICSSFPGPTSPSLWSWPVRSCGASGCSAAWSGG